MLAAEPLLEEHELAPPGGSRRWGPGGEPDPPAAAGPSATGRRARNLDFYGNMACAAGAACVLPMRAHRQPHHQPHHQQQQPAAPTAAPAADAAVTLSPREVEKAPPRQLRRSGERGSVVARRAGMHLTRPLSSHALDLSREVSRRTSMEHREAALDSMRLRSTPAGAPGGEGRPPRTSRDSSAPGSAHSSLDGAAAAAARGLLQRQSQEAARGGLQRQSREAARAPRRSQEAAPGSSPRTPKQRLSASQQQQQGQGQGSAAERRASRKSSLVAAGSGSSPSPPRRSSAMVRGRTVSPRVSRRKSAVRAFPLADSSMESPQGSAATLSMATGPPSSSVRRQNSPSAAEFSNPELAERAAELGRGQPRGRGRPGAGAAADDDEAESAWERRQRPDAAPEARVFRVKDRVGDAASSQIQASLFYSSTNPTLAQSFSRARVGGGPGPG